MAMIDWCEKSQSKAILGGTLTSQADGKSSTNALGNVHNEVRHDLMVSDAIQLGGTLTRDLVYPLLALNKGGVDDRRRLPRFVFRFDDSEDLGTLAEALPKLVAMGMRIKKEWAHERAGIPQAEDGDEVLGVARPNAASGVAANTSLAALSVQDVASDELDALAEDMAGDWERVTDPLIAPIVVLAAEAASFEEFQARLPDLIQGMDAAVLAEALAQGQFAARIWGKVNAAD